MLLPSKSVGQYALRETFNPGNSGFYVFLGLSRGETGKRLVNSVVRPLLSIGESLQQKPSFGTSKGTKRLVILGHRENGGKGMVRMSDSGEAQKQI